MSVVLPIGNVAGAYPGPAPNTVTSVRRGNNPGSGR